MPRRERMSQRLLVKMSKNVSEEVLFHPRRQLITFNLRKSCLLKNQMNNKLPSEAPQSPFYMSRRAIF